ncbi:MAG: copper resistance protein CopB [Porticoccus sp.]|jgi:copper resistance protein B|uniref:copper resistance protein B n=1 Tax=Cellvibrionales TaxID=1706369 RepID=UPI000C479E44|nr:MULTISPECIES: copper resistance protein B [Cellvibrionales]MAD65542.1 copper resistance protein CopB [Haliea sp.]MBG58451.1 copper resistance protein CopB [Porticoccus sp.]|tara:strand:+ start:5991 stop:6836 length:846 start_codon:yes stop_codon:yes gene_type:complete
MRLNTVKYLTTLVFIVGALQVNTALAQMDHDEMQMQGGSAPADARDPHAYSDGYTLTEGPYAQPGPRQLKLADEHAFWSILGDRLEYQEDSDSTVYDVQAWYGTTYDRFVIKAEGDIADGTLEESSTDLLWGHALNAYFDTQLGVRLDQYNEGKDRQWLAFGVQGLAPYWFELDVTAYVGDDGRTALSAEAEYELLLTQKLILQPRAELNLYGKDDAENGLGSGLSDLAVGLRLRYEFSRQFAPYIGVEWTDTYGDTADYRRAAGEDTSDTQFVAGLRFWF